jgi:hypothetical protein
MDIYELFDILGNNGELKKVLVFPEKTRIDDPYENTVSSELFNPVAIKAIVTQLSFSSLKWKYYGQLEQGSVQIICEKKYLDLIKWCGRLEIEDKVYNIYKDGGKGFSILERKDYIICIAEAIC